MGSVSNNDDEKANEEEEEEEEERPAPGWLAQLLSTEFFGACEEHKGQRKCEVNMYCIDCRRCLCQHCLSPPSCSHHPHYLLQIRRYVYQDVIRVVDMQKLLDCSKVQTFTVNGAKVVLLNPRKQQSKPSKPGVPLCLICSRYVAEPNRYCSIACKATEALGDPLEYSRRSEPSLPHLTSDPASCSTQEPVSSSSSPCVSSEASEESRSIEDPPPRRSYRTRTRKGRPHRSPLY